jgi:hypothetical protein
VSVCGTVSVVRMCSRFSGRYFDRNPARKGRFIHPELPGLDGYNHESAPAIMPRTLHENYTSTGILTRCPSPTLYCLGLGPTNPGTITVAQETLLFRWAGFSPALWLLIPTFSLPHAPANLAVHLRCREERSSTTPRSHISEHLI